MLQGGVASAAAASGPGSAGGREGSQREVSVEAGGEGGGNDVGEDDQLGPTHVNTTRASHLVKVILPHSLWLCKACLLPLI